MTSINDEWIQFMSQSYNEFKDTDTDEDIDENLTNLNNTSAIQQNQDCLKEPPVASAIYISTKSKIAYLTNPVDLNIFWEIPIMSYGSPKNGVIKKQIKLNSKTPEELNFIQNKIKHESYFEEQIISSIDNPNGRIKFKDIRKITIGISKKDIMSYRSKKKQAFYNCFVMIIRIKIADIFKEFHIKVFNTGKLEIPGVQNDDIFEKVLQYIIIILQPLINEPISYKQSSDNVLINSNFNCGFYIDREALADILKYKYKIHTIYDPCSYPGVHCKFYYNKNTKIQTGFKNENIIDSTDKAIIVPFMIFRTGSILIVGLCDECVLMEIYEFIKTLLRNEFKQICQKIITPENIIVKNKNPKLRKKIIYITP